MPSMESKQPLPDSAQEEMKEPAAQPTKISKGGLRILLKIIIFPWLFWSLAGYLPKKLHKNFGFAKILTRTLHFGMYLVFFFPLTILCLVEVIITANEVFLGEQSSYALQSDYTAGVADRTFPQMGPATADIPPIDKDVVDREVYYDYLTKLYSPVFFQKISHRPQWDIPLHLDFDDNINPRDNVMNEPKYRPHVAGIYGEVTAETIDAYYLTYSVYHVKDYDHPIREILSSWTYHDSDNEGWHLRVDKQSMKITDVETWFHNRFLLYNLTGTSTGSEPVHGTIHVEKGTHPLVYGQPQGHGVRLIQYTDQDFVKKNVKIFRYVGSGKDVAVKADNAFQNNATYNLKNFDAWYEQARGPYGKDGDANSTSLFSRKIHVGTLEDGTKLYIGRYISGLNYKIGAWSRPKPMWSWDDGWDNIPIASWHFFPSVAIQSHSGVKVSQDHIYNRPLDKIFGKTPEELAPIFKFEMSQRRDAKWKGLHGRGDQFDRNLYWEAINRVLKTYVNYVFRSVG